jgi:hypothetical protein
MPGVRQWVTSEPELSPDVLVKWLESPEGEEWSSNFHTGNTWMLAVVKDDLEAEDSYDEIAVFLWYA